MRDGIGNHIVEGSVLWMQHWGCIARVLKVHEGGLSVVYGDGRDRGVSPPVITVKIDIPLDLANIKQGQEPQLSGILCVVDPKSDEIIDRMMKQ